MNSRSRQNQRDHIGGGEGSRKWEEDAEEIGKNSENNGREKRKLLQ